MSERGDRFRSLIARTARVAQDGVASLPGVGRLRALAGDLRRGVLRVPAAALRAEMLRIEGLDSLSLAVREDGVRVEATFANGRALRVSLLPKAALFSPRGPKELVLAVSPDDARGAEIAELAAAIASGIVRTVAAPTTAGRPGPAPPTAIVERDGDGSLRIDLRSVGALRDVGPAARAILDALPVRGVSCEDDALLLELGVRTA